MIAFSISNEDVKRIWVWKPRNKDVGFLLHPKFWCFQKHAFLHNYFYLTFLRKNIDLLFRKSRTLRWYYVLKVHLKNFYTRHYFKMRKILTGAKLLLMSIFCRPFITNVFGQISVLAYRMFSRLNEFSISRLNIKRKL